jgi:hypothetical protein
MFSSEKVSLLASSISWEKAKGITLELEARFINIDKSTFMRVMSFLEKEKEVENIRSIDRFVLTDDADDKNKAQKEKKEKVRISSTVKGEKAIVKIPLCTCTTPYGFDVVLSEEKEKELINNSSQPVFVRSKNRKRIHFFLHTIFADLTTVTDINGKTTYEIEVEINHNYFSLKDEENIILISRLEDVILKLLYPIQNTVIIYSIKEKDDAIRRYKSLLNKLPHYVRSEREERNEENEIFCRKKRRGAQRQTLFFTSSGIWLIFPFTEISLIDLNSSFNNVIVDGEVEGDTFFPFEVLVGDISLKDIMKSVNFMRFNYVRDTREEILVKTKQGEYKRYGDDNVDVEVVKRMNGYDLYLRNENGDRVMLNVEVKNMPLQQAKNGDIIECFKNDSYLTFIRFRHDKTLPNIVKV